MSRLEELMKDNSVTNLSGVYPDVIDNTDEQQEVEPNSSVFMMGVSKFGGDNVYDFKNVTNMTKVLGNENVFKNGISQLCARLFVQTGAKVIWRGVQHPNATFANSLIYKTEQGTLAEVSLSGILNPEQLSVAQADGDSKIEQIKANRVFSQRGFFKGTGYNDIFTTYDKSEYENVDKESDGTVNYKFNFLNVRVFEKTNTVQAKTDSMLISLMKHDKEKSKEINNITSGDNIYVNDIQERNDFVTLKVNEEFSEELHKYKNIQNLCDTKQTPRIILEDASTITNNNINEKIFYEVFVDDSTGTPKADIRKTALPRTKEAIFEKDGNYYRFFVRIQNGIAEIVSEQITIEEGVAFFAGNEKYYVDGEEAFYELEVTVDNDKAKLNFEPFRFLRWELWTYLKNINHRLSAGADYLNDSSNPFKPFNKNDGSHDVSAMATVMEDVLSNDRILLEKFYPKHTFNYIFDWTQDLKLMNTKMNFAEYLGTSLNVIAVPSIQKDGLVDIRSADNDIAVRKQVLSMSSYNTVITSSQLNTEVIEGSRYKLSSNFYYLLNNILIDKNVSFTEPAVNMTKGTLKANQENLSNELDSEGMSKLKMHQINGIITDGQLNYFSEQVTALKKNTKLSLVNVVKSIQRLQLDLPKELKVYVQRKETDSVISSVINKINEILAVYKDGPHKILSDASVSVSFNNNILTATITITPIGTIEQIRVPIVVRG